MPILGWKEEMEWEEGLRETIEWYQKYTEKRYPKVEQALVPHPRQGVLK